LNLNGLKFKRDFDLPKHPDSSPLEATGFGATGHLVLVTMQRDVASLLGWQRLGLLQILLPLLEVILFTREVKGQATNLQEFAT
jgi:hypothetical protein